MRNKLISSLVASSLIGGSLLFATPAQASIMCLDLSTYRYIEMSSYDECRAYNSSTPDVVEEEPKGIDNVDPDPTVAPQEPVVDEVIDTAAEAEEILEDDAHGQDVVVQLANGDQTSREHVSSTQVFQEHRQTDLLAPRLAMSEPRHCRPKTGAR